MQFESSTQCYLVGVLVRLGVGVPKILAREGEERGRNTDIKWEERVSEEWESEEGRESEEWESEEGRERRVSEEWESEEGRERRE